MGIIPEITRDSLFESMHHKKDDGFGHMLETFLIFPVVFINILNLDYFSILKSAMEKYFKFPSTSLMQRRI